MKRITGTIFGIEYHSIKRKRIGSLQKSDLVITATCSRCGLEYSIQRQNLRQRIIQKRRIHTMCLNCTRTKHGMFGTRFYRIWCGMISRERSKTGRNAKYYALKGIKVCSRWHRFENFKEDMYATYKEDLTIDRINSNKDYCKENCRWVTQKFQNGNRATVILYKGENAAQASLRLGGRGLVQCRLKRGWSKERAFTTPAKPIKKST